MSDGFHEVMQTGGGVEVPDDKDKLSAEGREMLEFQERRSLRTFEKHFQNMPKLAEAQKACIKDYMISHPEQNWGFVYDQEDQDNRLSRIQRSPEGDVLVTVVLEGMESTSVIKMTPELKIAQGQIED